MCFNISQSIKKQFALNKEYLFSTFQIANQILLSENGETIAEDNFSDFKNIYCFDLRDYSTNKAYKPNGMSYFFSLSSIGQRKLIL